MPDNYLGDFLSHEVKPVQDMRGLGAHLQLKFPQCVVAIREKGDLLVHLQALRLQHLIQTSLRLGIQRRSYWIPGSYAPVLSEKRNSFFNDY